MDEGEARALVDGLSGGHHLDPAAKQTELTDALRSSPESAVRSILLRGLGWLARFSTDEHGHSSDRAIERSTTLLEQSVSEAIAAGRGDLVAEARLSLSGTLYLGAEVEKAMTLLKVAEQDAPREIVLRIKFQRATFAVLERQLEIALAEYAELLTLFESGDDQLYVAMTLSNRGNALLDSGDSDGARRDLERARAMFLAWGDDAQVAYIEHSLGRVDARTGDLLTALRRFRDSEQVLIRLKKDVADVQLNRCEVLLEAGLYADAEITAIETAHALGRSGHKLHRSQVLYHWCAALLGQMRFDEAASVARDAVTLFEELHLDGWAMRARVIELRGIHSPTAEIAGLASKLETSGQWLSAAHAWSAIARTDPLVARAGLERLPVPIDRAPFEFRLTKLVVDTLGEIASGDTAGALATTRAAMELGDRQRWLRGAVDLRAAVSAQLAVIAELGLELRLRRGRPWEVLRWSDRCRAVSLQAGTIRSSSTDEIGQLLAELRALHLEVRTTAVDEVATLLRRQADLQRRLVAAQRVAASRTAGHPTVIPRQRQPALVDVNVVHHHYVGDRVGAVVVRRGQASLVELGSRESIARHRTHLMRLLRQLASGVGDPLGAVERHAGELSRLLLPELDGAPTVVVPTADLLAVPWPLLPSTEANPITVAPSLAHWLATPAHTEVTVESIGLVAGIDLAGAGDEVDTIAGVWEGLQVHAASPASVADAIAVVEHSDIAHLACHGERSSRDGRFAQLRLADGNLTGLELSQLARLPRLMVFAACDAGLLEPLPGDEASGLAGVLFAAGVATVIAPVGLLPDTEATTRCMVELHRNLALGLSPSDALFTVQRSAPPGREQALARTISCFGRG